MHAIASREHDEDRDWQCGQILLVFHAFVGRQQHVELTRREREKFAILDAGPAPALNCHDRVTRQQRAEPPGTDSSSRMRIGNECHPCVLQNLYRKFAADGGKVLQENFEGIARFKVFKDDADGHTSAHENRRSAEDLWVRNDARGLHGDLLAKDQCTAAGACVPRAKLLP
jgi:hypothetical protein